jgi:DNA-binding NtrC family response regulator
LAIAIQEKRFREDLFYRLNVVCIRVPLLRERLEDITTLVRYFLCRQSVEMGIKRPSIQNEAMEFLQRQPWLGNVRELESTVRRALLITPGYPITLRDVQQAMLGGARCEAISDQTLATLVNEYLARAERGEVDEVYAKLLAILEEELFAQAIKVARGNQVRVARWLGISRLTLRQRLRRLGLSSTAKTE